MIALLNLALTIVIAGLYSFDIYWTKKRLSEERELNKKLLAYLQKELKEETT